MADQGCNVHWQVTSCSVLSCSGYALIFSHIVSIKYKITFVVRCNGRRGVFTHVILAAVRADDRSIEV